MVGVTITPIFSPFRDMQMRGYYDYATTYATPLRHCYATLRHAAAFALRRLITPLRLERRLRAARRVTLPCRARLPRRYAIYAAAAAFQSRAYFHQLRFRRY